MITLFIDTADKDLNVAVIKDNIIISSKKESNDIKLSSKLVPFMKEVIDNVIDKNDIDNILVVNGPGSFTGARMGVTVAKTYAWAKNIKINAISKLELLASTPFQGDFIMPIIDANHGYVYAGLYDINLNRVLKDSYIKIEDLLLQLPKDKTIIVVSNDQIEMPFNKINPNEDIVKVINKHINDKGINPHTLNPEYLKKTEAEERLNG
jgi:tRNA threonylcarbamoyladenosine biosynthesis protein TsaB